MHHRAARELAYSPARRDARPLPPGEGRFVAPPYEKPPTHNGRAHQFISRAYYSLHRRVGWRSEYVHRPSETLGLKAEAVNRNRGVKNGGLPCAASVSIDACLRQKARARAPPRGRFSARFLLVATVSERASRAIVSPRTCAPTLTQRAGGPKPRLAEREITWSHSLTPSRKLTLIKRVSSQAQISSRSATHTALTDTDKIRHFPGQNPGSEPVQLPPASRVDCVADIPRQPHTEV